MNGQTLSATPRYRLIVILMTFFVLTWSTFVRAETIPLNNAVLRIVDGMVVLDASYDVNFTRVQESALESGLPLYFVFEWRVTFPRWYWFDKTVLKNEALLTLSLVPLTRQYRLTSGWLTQTIATADEAERLVGQIASRSLFPLADFEHGERYQLSFRLRLDHERMSKPMQISTLGSPDWSLQSDWHTLDFIP